MIVSLLITPTYPITTEDKEIASPRGDLSLSDSDWEMVMKKDGEEGVGENEEKDGNEVVSGDTFGFTYMYLYVLMYVFIYKSEN